MLTIHHLQSSQSERVVWLCEELNVPYTLKRYERDPETRLAPAEYKALHPFGTAPVIDDGDLRLAESGAILEYIANTYGGGQLIVAPGAPNYADYLHWWHFANASFVSAAIVALAVQRVGDGSANPTVRALMDRVELAWTLSEERLSKVPYLAGQEFTLADVITHYPLDTMRAFMPRDMAKYPHVSAYLKRIRSRPAFARMMAKAEPDQPFEA